MIFQLPAPPECIDDKSSIAVLKPKKLRMCGSFEQKSCCKECGCNDLEESPEEEGLSSTTRSHFGSVSHQEEDCGEEDEVGAG